MMSRRYNVWLLVNKTRCYHYYCFTVASISGQFKKCLKIELLSCPTLYCRGLSATKG